METVSNILQNEGFHVDRDLKLGERFYVDLLAYRDTDKKAVLIEFKPSRFIIDQSDIMQIIAYRNFLKNQPNFTDKVILSCVIASGSNASASHLASDVGVHLITSSKAEILSKDIKTCISSLPERREQ
jgi:hypothetical protein